MNEPRCVLALIAAAIFLSGSAMAAAAAAPSDPRGVVVEDVRNDRPAFMVRVGVDRPDHVYRGGDEMHVRVDAERDGYLYLLYCDAEGNMTSLFPNQLDQDNRIKAGSAVEIPGPGAPFRLRIAPPYGREVLKAIVSLAPLEPKQVKSLVAGAGTAEKVGGVKAVYVEMKNQPATWAEHYVATTTLPPEGSAAEPGSPATLPAGGTSQPALPAGANAGGPQSLGRRVGVFIGISDFRDPAIRDLRVGYKDAVVMADAMRRFGRLDESTVLINEQATLGNIEQAVRRWLPAVTRPGDTAIFYWSGHGARCADDNGDEKDGYDEYLVPHDGRLGDIETIRGSMLLDDTFGRWVQELDGRRLAIILDTCHSGGQTAEEKSLGKGLDVGPAVGGGAAFDFLDGEMQRAKDIGQQDTVLLASSQAAQVSFERREGDLSTMTYFFVAAVVSANRPLTITDIYGQIRPQVAEYVEKTFPGTTQTPVLVDNLLGTMYIRP